MALWMGQSVSSLGNPFTMMATAWYVYEITGSKWALGGIMLANTLPLAFARIFAGTLADRIDRRRIMLIADWTRAFLLALMAILLLIGMEHIFYFYILNVAMGLAEAFFQPAIFAMLPNLVKKEQLLQANSLMNISLMGALLLGPALSGVVVARWGAANAIVIDAATFAVSGLSLLLLPGQRLLPEAEKSRFISLLAEGFSFFKGYKVLLWLLFLSSISNLVFGILLVNLLPFAVDILQAGAVGYGLIQTLYGAGMLFGSLLGPFLKKFNRRDVIIASYVFSGCMLFFQMFSHTLLQTLIFALGMGIGFAIWNVSSDTLYQQLVPDAYRGRVQSVRLLIAQGSFPLGMAIGPLISEWLNVQIALAAGGMAMILSGLFIYGKRSFRKLDDISTK